MEKNLLEDVAKLSNIKSSIIKKFARVAEYCISDYVLESKIEDEDLTEIDVGIGKLTLLVDDDSLSYKFVPSTRLEKMIVDAYQKEESILTEKVEEGLENRLLSAYKELF